MPYKNQEDRTEAVRRYREREKGLKVAGFIIVRDDETLGDFLRKLGFEEISYEEFVEICRDNKKADDGKWYNGAGQQVYPPKQVFYGWNTLIIGDDIE